MEEDCVQVDLGYGRPRPLSFDCYMRQYSSTPFPCRVFSEVLMRCSSNWGEASREVVRNW